MSSLILKAGIMTPGNLSLRGIGRIAIAAAALVVGLAVGALSAAQAGGRPASFVIDANTGSVISASNADEPRFPASLTKMMTLYVVFDLIEQGRLNAHTRIRMSDRAAAAPPSKLGLEEGDDIELIDAMKALVTRSANDIAVAIAEHIAGSEDKFAALMTQKARAIGMKASTFKNASGLPNESQVTTARDMVTLGLRLHDDFPKHYVLFSLREFRYGGNSHANHNTMLNSYEGTEGIKTGYTTASGFNLVASVKRNSKHVMGAVFGGASAASRNQTMRTLLNIALLKASSTKTRAPTTAVGQSRLVAEPRPAARPAARPALQTASKSVQPVASTAEVVQAPKSREMASKDLPTKELPMKDWAPKLSLASKVEPIAETRAPDVKVAAVEVPKALGTIEIAKVRPVLVAPRPPRQAPVAIAAAPSAAVSGSTAEPEPVRAAVPNVPVSFQLPPLAAGAAATPQAAPTRSGAVVRAPAPQVVAADAPVTAASVVAPSRGNRPSTLQQQAASLASNQAAPAYHLSGPPRAAPAASAEIQIGAFSSAAEADRQLGIARGKAGDLIGTAPAVTQPTTANGKPVWRARFGGFQAAQATVVCTELRRRQIDCLVVRAE